MVLQRAVEWVCVLVHEHHRQQRVYWIGPGWLFEAIYSSKAIDFCVHQFSALILLSFSSLFQQDLLYIWQPPVANVSRGHDDEHAAGSVMVKSLVIGTQNFNLVFKSLLFAYASSLAFLFFFRSSHLKLATSSYFPSNALISSPLLPPPPSK